jgi:hypothetical protein
MYSLPRNYSIAFLNNQKKIGLLWLVMCLSMVGWAADKHALLIMISHYPKESGWPALNAQNDRQLLTQALKNQGFKRITILSNQEATADNIRKACAQLTLATQNGDKVVLAFSGHGQQIFDADGDEADHLDEALVSYDAPRKVDFRNYQGQKHILDDEIGVFVQQMKLKLGPDGQFILLLDCCHAGTGARADAQAFLRGGALPIIPSNFKEKLSLRNQEGSGFDEGYFSTRGKDATFVLLTGAAASQPNYEVKNESGVAYGALSYAFCEALCRLKKKEIYRGLFTHISRILSQKAPFQTPTMEGDSDSEVFGGELIVQHTAVEALAEKSVQYCQKVRVGIGELAGVFTNAVFQFVPKTSARGDSALPVVKGKVISADAFGSIIELERAVPLEFIKEIRAEETEKAFGEVSKGVFIGYCEDNHWQNQLTTKIKAYPLLRLTSLVHSAYSIYQNGNIVKLTDSATQQVLDSLTKTEDVAEQCIERLLAFTRAEILRKIELSQDFAKVEVQLKQSGQVNTAIPTVKINTPTVLTLTNKSTQPVYVSIADIQPDGLIHVILPDAGRDIPPLKLAPDETHTLSLTVMPPLGFEMYKVFITPSFLDLSALINTRGDVSLAHPLKQLFYQTYRGEVPGLLNTSELAILSYSFRIVP